MMFELEGSSDVTWEPSAVVSGSLLHGCYKVGTPDHLGVNAAFSFYLIAARRGLCVTTLGICVRLGVLVLAPVEGHVRFSDDVINMLHGGNDTGRNSDLTLTCHAVIIHCNLRCVRTWHVEEVFVVSTA
jgi:hypothetical protein